jgi:tetratricopeptide (TPR) repeat protein
MAKIGSLLVLLLVGCPAGHAEEAPDPTGPTFWPAPISQPVLPTTRSRDPAAPVNRADPSRSPSDDEQRGQSASRAELSARVDKHLKAIEREQAANGERSPALIDHLTALAEAYRELGQYESAVAALDDAVQIARINFGLYSLEQADAVESLVDVAQISGEDADAAGRRRYLRDLARRNADDPRTVGILHRLAESEMDIARRALGQPAPSQLIINSNAAYAPVRVPQSPSLAALLAARTDYIAAIRAAVRTGTGSVEDLFALEDTLVDTVHFEFEHPEVHGPHSVYASLTGAGPAESVIRDAGLQILENRVRDSVSFARAPEEIAAAMLAVGDWHLLFSEFGVALDDYAAARNLLVKGGVSVEAIDALLSPELPLALPVRPASVGSGGHSFRGYIEATVELTQFGEVKRVDILGYTAGVSKTIEKGFRRYLRAMVFRPRFVNGEIPRFDRFDARFYFDY